MNTNYKKILLTLSYNCHNLQVCLTDSNTASNIYQIKPLHCYNANICSKSHALANVQPLSIVYQVCHLTQAVFR